MAPAVRAIDEAPEIDRHFYRDVCARRRNGTGRSSMSCTASSVTSPASASTAPSCHAMHRTPVIDAELTREDVLSQQERCSP